MVKKSFLDETFYAKSGASGDEFDVAYLFQVSDSCNLSLTQKASSFLAALHLQVW